NHRLREREAEYEYCFRRNLEHRAVASVHNLVQPETRVPEEFRSHPKYIEHHHPGQWITFKSVFDYANTMLPDQTVATMNLDTFLDDSLDTWNEIPELMQQSIVLCLSRTEFQPNAEPYKDPLFSRLAFANSQDA